MTSHAIHRATDGFHAPTTAGADDVLNPASAAFAMSATIAIVFNTLLTWGKEAYPPVNAFMASISGHHWITHGLADIALFAVLGLLFLKLGTSRQLSGMHVVVTLVAAVFAGGLGLAAWFVFV